MAPLTPIRRINDLREYVHEQRSDGRRIGLVPTMGALHEGHLSLVEAIGQHVDAVIVSIFVNPTQFAAHEDLDIYPRHEVEDLKKLATTCATAVFAPSVDEIYPTGFATSVAVEGPALGLETDIRPHFFAGVGLVVTKLLLQALPDVAIFGEKDYQQLLVIRRIVRDLDIPVEIVGGPIIREATVWQCHRATPICLAANARLPAASIWFCAIWRKPRTGPIFPKQKRMMRCWKPGFPPSIMPAFATPRRWPRPTHKPRTVGRSLQLAWAIFV